ncbi:MAG TPA: magnesium transporter [Gammaproteobacteria bacterium]
MTTEQGLATRAVNRAFLIDYSRSAARAIDSFSKSEAAAALENQDLDAVVAIWPHLSPARAIEILELFDDERSREVLEALDPSLSAAALMNMPESGRERFLGLVSPELASELARLMSYPPGTAGRVMDSRVRTFHLDDTVDQTLNRLRELKPKNVRQLLVVDDERRLTATVDIQDLAMAVPEQQLREIAQPPRATTSPFESREQVAEQLKSLNLDVLPVVDVNGYAIGVIRHAALLQTLSEETSADIQKMVGVSREERALSSPFLSIRKRLPWMQINLATAFLAASVVGLFESTIAMFTALAVLLPVVAGQSGNAGAQALAVTMRGLALREITGRHWFRVMFKEINVGVMNGLAVALTTGIGVLIWSGNAGLTVIISVSMVISMVAAGISGALIPITLTRFGQDPAQSSSILLTTVTDVVGFMSFLGIATVFSAIL